MGGNAHGTKRTVERDHYVIRGGVEGRERLRILARVMQPTIRSLFDRVQIGAGMACLDVGCGGGDVTLELARRVGPEGRVVGWDIDETKLGLARREAEEQGLGNVDFRLSDIGHSEAEREFDAVYARFLLTHLQDPAGALAGMRQMLRPGGVAIVEDIDFTGYFCHPPAAALLRYVELYTQAVRRRGGDANIGPRLPGLLLDAGFEGVQMNVLQPAGLDGEVKLINPITMETIADCVLSEGLATRSEIDKIVDELYELARDSKTVVSLPRVVQTWGYRAGADPRPTRQACPCRAA
jgi:SAM-dependent methyltransferase